MSDTKSQRTTAQSATEAGVISYERQADDTLLVRLEGSWRIGSRLPAADEALQKMGSESNVKQIAFDTQALAGWDSGLLTFLTKIKDWCSQNSIQVEPGGLPDGVRRLLSLAAAVPAPLQRVCCRPLRASAAARRRRRRGDVVGPLPGGSRGGR